MLLKKIKSNMISKSDFQINFILSQEFFFNNQNFFD
jgi:hypothetical protein